MRDSDDLETRLWVLQYERWALWSPENLTERLAGSAQLLELATSSEAKDRRALAHSSRLTDVLESGDGAGVDAQLAAFVELAEASGRPWYVWSALRYRVTCALLRGANDVAAELLDDALSLGGRLEHVDVLPLHAAQSAVSRLQHGRSQEFLVPLEAIVTLQSTPAWRAMLALVQIESGTADGRAAAQRTRLALASGFGSLSRHNIWLTCGSLLAEVALALAVRGVARRLGMPQLETRAEVLSARIQQGWTNVYPALRTPCGASPVSRGMAIRPVSSSPRPDLTPDRAFVLQLLAGSRPPERWSGQVDRIASGRAQRFESLAELVDFVADILPMAADDPQTGSSEPSI